MAKKNPHAVALGSLRSPRKAAAARANGQKGGRPAVVHYGTARPACRIRAWTTLTDDRTVVTCPLCRDSR